PDGIGAATDIVHIWCVHGGLLHLATTTKHRCGCHHNATCAAPAFNIEITQSYGGMPHAPACLVRWSLEFGCGGVNAGGWQTGGGTAHLAAHLPDTGHPRGACPATGSAGHGGSA